MKTQKLGKEDSLLLAELEKAAFEHPWSQGSLEAELEKEGSLALGHRGSDTPKLEAYVLFSRVLDEAELLRIATHPEARRKGHARILLAEGLGQLHQAGIREVFLEVEENNHPARQLYEAFGFEPSGRRPAYYPSGAAAILYRKELDEAPRP